MIHPSFRQLRAFLAVARLGSFGRAAEALHVSPPALSQAIAMLEQAVGGRLFDRTTRSVELTALGRALLPGAQRIEAEVERSFSELHDLATLVRGRVELGCLASLVVRVMPRVITDFAARHPGIRIRVRDDNAAGLRRRLLAGEIEFALTSPPQEEQSIAFRCLAADPFRLLCPPGHVLASRRHVTWAELAAHRVIGFDPETSNRLNIERALAEAGVRLDFAMELSQLGTVVGMVHSHAGVAPLPSMACPEGMGLPSVPLVQPVLRREVGIATLAGRSLAPAAAQLADAVAGWFGTHQHLAKDHRQDMLASRRE